jgi:peptidoglycan glycosyltransferase
LAAGADSVLLPLAVLLNGLGYVMIARLSERLAALQTTWTFVGVLAFAAILFGIQRVNDLSRYSWTFFFAGAGLLVLPMIPGLGFSSGGARIWVSIGPINFQPGEFAKVALALFFAGYLADNRELLATGSRRIGKIVIPDSRYLLPLLGAWGFAVMIMVGQRDLGSSLLFFTLFIVMVWVATERTAYLVVGSGLFLFATTAAYMLFDHVQTRVAIWLDPWSRYSSKGYQIAQGIFALGSGGVGGTGLGLGDPTRIPEAKNDFIFAAIGEELGLFGATAILLAYVLMIGAGLRVATRTNREFFILLGGVIRVVPLTGITLPFVSYGGSSLVANYMLLALLIRVSDSSARRLGEIEDKATFSERVAQRIAIRREIRESRAPRGRS